MDKVFLKRRYYDFRIGHATLSPILQFGNFIMLAYLAINKFIPIEIFAPIFVVTILIAFTTVGHKIRDIQHTTDHDMVYDKTPEAAKTRFVELEAILSIMEKNDIIPTEKFLKRMDKEKRISERTI